MWNTSYASWVVAMDSGGECRLDVFWDTCNAYNSYIINEYDESDCITVVDNGIINSNEIYITMSANEVSDDCYSSIEVRVDNDCTYAYFNVNVEGDVEPPPPPPDGDVTIQETVNTINGARLYEDAALIATNQAFELVDSRNWDSNPWEDVKAYLTQAKAELMPAIVELDTANVMIEELRDTSQITISAAYWSSKNISFAIIMDSNVIAYIDKFLEVCCYDEPDVKKVYRALTTFAPVFLDLAEKRKLEAITQLETDQENLELSKNSVTRDIVSPVNWTYTSYLPELLYLNIK